MSTACRYRIPPAAPLEARISTELYITSATLGLSAKEKEASPQSGDLFRLRAGIKGMDRIAQG